MTHKWIQGAVKHPGALKAKAKRAGLLGDDGALTEDAIATIRARAKVVGDHQTVRQAVLADTLRKLRGGG